MWRGIGQIGLLVAVLAIPARGARIGLRWAAAPTQQNLDAGQATIEVWTRLSAEETVSGVIFNWDARGAGLMLTGQTAAPTGWMQSGAMGSGT
ncbi:MAG: hypothetical protein H6816_05045 [Phycisphaerales bacterium]|nr:hypothetical protein [Phycisphaerales bacterium]